VEGCERVEGGPEGLGGVGWVAEVGGHAGPGFLEGCGYGSVDSVSTY
jgi:hypothetical protein